MSSKWFRVTSGIQVMCLHFLLRKNVFNVKRTIVIEFGEFVRLLGVFHPSAPVADKIT